MTAYTNALKQMGSMFKNDWNIRDLDKIVPRQDVSNIEIPKDDLNLSDADMINVGLDVLNPFIKDTLQQKIVKEKATGATVNYTMPAAIQLEPGLGGYRRIGNTAQFAADMKNIKRPRNRNVADRITETMDYYN